MSSVLRWGQSAYETDADLALERRAAEELGWSWRSFADVATVPPWDDVEVLVITSGVRVSAKVLQDFPGRLIVATTSGVDHIDLDACGRLGVRVVRLPEARRDAVVEHALGAMISLMRRFPALEAEAKRGVWARSALPALSPTGLRGSTVAVVGLGVIGQRMVEVLRALNAHVLGVDPYASDVALGGVERSNLDDALSRADAVTIHCALTPSSRDLFNAVRIGGMRPSAVLVNTARGEVVDVSAAVTAVERGRLRGFSTDVFPVEPYPSLNLGQVPGVQFSPHSAGFTHDLGLRVAQGVALALAAWKAGTNLPHVVI